MSTSAKVICDSVSDDGHRLTTLEVTMHRFVLAEFNTHRVFSRNSASSRAIPVRKIIDRVLTDPAVPLSWPSEKSGMQGGEPLSGDHAQAAEEMWLSARDEAVAAARRLMDLGVHKSIANRLLEPFMWHTVIVSATNWDNFWGLRLSPLAQREISAAAFAMKSAYDKSQPQPLTQGEWHLPYLRPDERDMSLDVKMKVSAARCARVSYLTHDGIRDVAKDLELYDRLTTTTPPHASPLEHVATPCPPCDDHCHLGNFTGWDQLRHRDLKAGR